MYFQESDILLNRYPQYKEQIQTIDEFFHSLTPEESMQLKIEVISDLTGLSKEIIEFLIQEYCNEGLLKKKLVLCCLKNGDVIREINEIPDGEFEEFCDICGENHTFTKENIEPCYEIVKFPNPVENNEIDETKFKETMPLLDYICTKIENEPFAGKRFIIILHFLKDLIPFMEWCKNLGLNPSETILFYKNYLYPYKGEIIDYFQKKGYFVSPLESIDEVLTNFQIRCQNSQRPIIVIEDGGYIVPKIHSNEFNDLRVKTMGAVEQTTKGERNDKKVKLEFPVISVAGSELKNNYEPPHVARAVINNIQHLLDWVNFSSQEALVIGSGSIGKEIAKQLKDTLNMNVTIFDIDADKRLEATQQGFKVQNSCSLAVQRKFLIIGATGETSIGRSELLAMKHNVYLVSASSGQAEIGIGELRALSSKKDDITNTNDKKIGTKYTIGGTTNTINLIADGYPINFWAEESMPNQVSDLIMTLIFVSALEIALNSSKLKNEVNSEVVNELAKYYELSKIYLEHYHEG